MTFGLALKRAYSLIIAAITGYTRFTVNHETKQNKHFTSHFLG